MVSRERRREPRHEVLGLHGRTLAREPLSVRDLSRSGVQIETSARLRPGTTVRFRLTAGGAEFGIEGRCAWAHFSGARSAPGAGSAIVYNAGLEFDARAKDTEARLRRLLRDHAIFPPPQPLACILPAGQPPLPGMKAAAGEVRKVGRPGLAAVFPLLPPLGPVDLEVTVLLGGVECFCRGRVVEQRRVRLSPGNDASELLLAWAPGPGAAAGPPRGLESFLRELEERDDVGAARPGEAPGAASMLA